MKLPISVCVPLSERRKTIFTMLVAPSIKRNQPMETLISSTAGNANEKRNASARDATQEFLFFCDDDILLEKYCLRRLYQALEGNPVASYAYCDFVVHNHPTRSDALVRPGIFDASKLRRQNYISTMSLIRRDAFEAVGGFDESILRFQDWDLWLLLLKRGITGMYVPQVLFTALYLDSGITKGINGAEDAMRIVMQKHGLTT